MNVLLSTDWNFTLTNYSSVWHIIIQLCLVLVCLLLGHLLSRIIPFLRKAFIPSALIGGLILLLLDYLTTLIVKSTGNSDFSGLIDKNVMQVLTYHGLGIGFIAMTLKVQRKDAPKVSFKKAAVNGCLTGGCYMLQAVLGILVTIILGLIPTFSYLWKGSGIILPLAFGQGPGNALTWDVNYSNMGLMTANFDGQTVTTMGSFGLSLASIGFIVASIFGVIYINIYKKRGEIQEKESKTGLRDVTVFEEKHELEDNASVDKFSIQLGLVMLSYAGAFGIMCLFTLISNITNVALFNSVAWGFNFIWGVITANIVKKIMKKMYIKGHIKQKYINNYQMDRISGFAFDLMIVAGVAAIDIGNIKGFILPIIILSIVGTVSTFIYVKIITKRCFKGFEHEMFLVNFGTVTGTASNGMILLKEIDPNFETPASSLFVASQLPAMIFVAPLLLFLDFASGAGGKEYKTFIAFGIFAVLLIIYTILLFIFGKKSSIENKPTISTEQK